MIILKLEIMQILIFLRVCGIPLDSAGHDCERFWWNVVGNHYDGKICDQNLETLKEAENYMKASKNRLTKRDDTSRLTENSALGTIGNLMNIVNSNLNLNIKSDAAVACKACKTGIQMLRVFIGLSKSNEDLLKLATSLCVELKIMTEEVCDGLVRINGPAIIYILKTSKMSPLDICSFLMKTDCDNAKNADHVWHVGIPEIDEDKLQKLSKKDVVIKEDAPRLKVLHISDTHFDPHYKEGTWAECSLPLCCRETNGEPIKNTTLSGPWGGWKCDVPEKTLDNLLEHVNEQHPDIDYVLWTGDLPPHDSWSLFRNDSLDILNRTLAKMIKHFPNIPVYPALGNHEAVPPNLFPPSTVSGEEWSVDWLYEKLEKEWSHWLSKNSSETLRQGAFYTIKIRQGLRIVSLNTNYCYYNNWWLILNSTDPMQELKWLITVLQQAEENEEKVHIIGHVPPGHADCLKMWQENYYNIIRRFNCTVTAQFFGHTHTDEFELFYDKNDLNHPLGVAYVGPSVTTYTYLNPGYRIYYVDGDHNETTRFVTDHETWIMDLESANENDAPQWYKLYSAKDAYNMTALTPQDWHNFFQRLFKDDDLMNLYYKHYWKNSPRRPQCDGECRKKLFCDIRSCDQGSHSCARVRGVAVKLDFDCTAHFPSDHQSATTEFTRILATQQNLQQHEPKIY